MLGLVKALRAGRESGCSGPAKSVMGSFRVRAVNREM